MDKNMIKGFFSNKLFFVFAGLFVLVTVAYLFADNKLGSHTETIEGFLCKPHNSKCAETIRIFVKGQKVTDGCEKTPEGKCSGTCYWCEPSNDRGRYCALTIEYSGHCSVDIPNKPLACGPSRPHKCLEDGDGHGISGCCPDEDKNIEPKGNCDNIATCSADITE